MELSVNLVSAPAMTFPSSTLPARAQPGTVLLTSTSWWPFTARIAIRFASLGWRVEALCPSGHPLRTTRVVARLHDDAPLRPAAALAAAIAEARPDFIVPCDDRACANLHAMYEQPATEAAPARGIIARSLGRPDSYPVAERRSDLIRIAREEGVRAAEMRPVATSDDLDAALEEFGLPVVLKADGTWGGNGVAVAHTRAEAEQHRSTLGRRLDLVRALKRLLVDRDPYHLLPWMTRARPRLSVQRFIRGRPANSVAACWQGEMLASIEVEVLRAHEPLGASNVVRTIDHPDMTLAGERLVRRLGLSGFCGFDFMIEDGTGHAYLIEMNPRATPICHLALGPGRDPIAALAARLEGAPPPATAAITSNPVIAFFPQAWHYAPDNSSLAGGYHDVPWEDPALVRELTKLPYSDRGAVARLLARLRRLPHTGHSGAKEIVLG